MAGYIFREAPRKSAAQQVRERVELRESLSSEPMATPPRDLLEPPISRLAFIRPGIGTPELPEDGAEIGLAPESWSTEVTELAPSSPGSKSSSTTSNAARTSKPIRGHYTLKQRLAEISPAALARVQEKFQSAKAAWPPAELAFVAIKDEKALEVYSRGKDGSWAFVHRYRVLAASGGSGPKLQRGDRQVPEGVYRISYLNPNSAYHVSMRVNYPNSFDKEMAKKDGRKDLGGDIMIHGKRASAGCLAVGDTNAEELFVLAAEVGLSNVKVVIAPTDFRKSEPATPANAPVWVPRLYTEIKTAMADYKAPPPPSLLSLLGF